MRQSLTDANTDLVALIEEGVKTEVNMLSQIATLKKKRERLFRVVFELTLKEKVNIATLIHHHPALDNPRLRQCVLNITDSVDQSLLFIESFFETEFDGFDSRRSTDLVIVELSVLICLSNVISKTVSTTCSDEDRQEAMLAFSSQTKKYVQQKLDQERAVGIGIVSSVLLVILSLALCTTVILPLPPFLTLLPLMLIFVFFPTVVMFSAPSFGSMIAEVFSKVKKPRSKQLEESSTEIKRQLESVDSVSKSPGFFQKKSPVPVTTGLSPVCFRTSSLNA